MPVPIPAKVYKSVEWHLHNVKAIREQIDNARAAVMQSNRAFDLGVPSGHSKHADPTAAKAIALIDSTKKAENWLKAIKQTRLYFDGMPQAVLFTRYYGAGISSTELSTQIGIDRTKLHRWRDEIVTRCAMEAVARGLIRLNDAESEGTYEILG